LRNSWDVLLVPFYIGFGYYHSWIKLKAMFTWWDTSWGSREEVDIVAVAATNSLLVEAVLEREHEEHEKELEHEKEVLHRKGLESSL